MGDDIGQFDRVEMAFVLESIKDRPVRQFAYTDGDDLHIQEIEDAELRAWGLELSFDEIEPAAYAEFHAKHTFEPNVWGWGVAVPDGQAIYRVYCAGCHSGDASGDRGIETPMGNLIADAILWGTQAPENGGAQIAFMNPGGLRADMTGNADDGYRMPRFAYDGVLKEARAVITGAPFDQGKDSALWADLQAKADALVKSGAIDEARATALKAQARQALLDNIEPGYRDIWGRRHATSAASQRALLAAMGVPAASAAEVESSLAAAAAAAAGSGAGAGRNTVPRQ